MVRRERPLPPRNTFDRGLWMAAGHPPCHPRRARAAHHAAPRPGRCRGHRQALCAGGGAWGAKGDSPIVAARKIGTVPRNRQGGQVRAPSRRSAEAQAGHGGPSGTNRRGPGRGGCRAEEFQAVTDGTLKMSRADMFAYKRLLQWVKNQPASLMEKRARTDVTFNDLMLSPEEYRGALVKLNLTAQSVIEDKRGRKGSSVFRFTRFGALPPIPARFCTTWWWSICPKGCRWARGSTRRSASRGTSSSCRATCRPRPSPGAAGKAPLLVGRVVWAEPAPPEAAGTNWTWVWGVLGLFLVWIGVRAGLMLFRRPRKHPARS